MSQAGTSIHQTDEELLRAAVERPALFGELVDRYQEKLFRLAFSIVRQKEEAEDIVQEAFMKIYLHANRFKKQEGASFKSWAYRIAFNNSISHYRKLKRTRERETVLEPEMYENLPGESRIVAETDARITALKLLDKLPKELRRVMKMYYFEDKSYSTIALEEGIPLSTLKMRLFRAKKLLKNMVYETL